MHFWSINCPACRAEEPSLQALKRRYGNQGLEIFGVNLVDQPANIVRHAKASHCPFPVLFDSGKGFSLRTVSMSGRKTAFVLNPEQEALFSAEVRLEGTFKSSLTPKSSFSPGAEPSQAR